jgi:hypothetical protein
MHITDLYTKPSEQSLELYAAMRHYFEYDVKFDGPMAGVLLSAYNKAAKAAQLSAGRAISDGDMSSIRTAQWDEAVVKTIEAVLCCVPHTQGSLEFSKDDAIELPSRPKF